MRRLRVILPSLTLAFAAQAKVFWVQNDRTPVYSAPSERASVVGHLPQGKRVDVAREKPPFVRIRSRSDQTLWVKLSALGPEGDWPYRAELDVEPNFPRQEPPFKRVRLDLGASAGTVDGVDFVEGAAGLEYFMMERLSWRNAVFFRRAPLQNDFFGLDSSVRGNGRIPLGPLSLRGILGAGYRFAGMGEDAPFLEVGGFAALGGFDIGLMLKLLHHSIGGTGRQDVVLYSLVFSGTTGFF